MLIANICHVPHFAAKRHADATTSGSAGPFAALPQVREGQNKSEKRAQLKLLQGKFIHSFNFIHMAWSPEISCALEHCLPGIVALK